MFANVNFNMIFIVVLGWLLGKSNEKLMLFVFRIVSGMFLPCLVQLSPGWAAWPEQPL